MSAVDVMRLMIIGIGLGVVLASFWAHAAKWMTPDLAAVWCVAGFLLIAVGAVPALSGWLFHLSIETGMVLLCSGGAFLIAAFYLCLLISRLIMQNMELAMQISLLLAERSQAAQREGEEALEETVRC